MNSSTNTIEKRSIHPLIIAAAVAVMLFSAVGTAAIMGWLPSSIGGNANRGALTASDQLAVAPQPVAPALPARSQLSAQPSAQPYSEPSAQPYSQPYSQPKSQPHAQPYAADAPMHREAAAAPVRHKPARKAASCSHCGVIESVREINTRAEGSGVGAAGGAVVGGLLGNQVGGGRGRDVATIVGAIGGAVAGNQIEGHVKATRSYDVTIRLNDGSTRTIHQTEQPGWRSGDRVKIVNGAIRANG